MLVNWQRIIRLMLDFYRRLWQAFFVAVPVWVGAALVAINHLLLFVILLILALICLIIALIGLRLDYLDARKIEYKQKHPVKGDIYFS